jgi:hypothetical protein
MKYFASSSIDDGAATGKVSIGSVDLTPPLARARTSR